MYPPLELKQLPAPNLSALEMMNLEGKEYNVLKENLSQTIEDVVKTVSYHYVHSKETSTVFQCQ